MTPKLTLYPLGCMIWVSDQVLVERGLWRVVHVFLRGWVFFDGVARP